MKTSIKFTVLILAGFAAGYFTNELFEDTSTNESVSSQSQEKKPLYWVAPMDPSFKSDKPGKSPMGMDLVPVYEKKGDTGIKISRVEAHNLAIRTALVTKGEFSGELNTVGYVGYDEDEVVHIHTRVKGWIEKLQIKAIGDEVKKGDLLFQLYSPELVNASKEYLISIKSGQKSLINAARDRLIYLGLNKNQVSELRRTQKVSDRISIYAPMAGVIGKINIGEGAFVGPSKEIMSISNLDQIWINADIFQRDASLVKKGQTAEIKVQGYPGRVWEGTIDYVYPVLNPRSRTLRVRFVVDNEDSALKPNMFAEINVSGETTQESIQIPRAALIRGPINRVVVKTDHEHYLVKAVRPGRESSQYVQILSGLKGDEEVVVSSQFLIDSESNLDEALKRLQAEENKSALPMKKHDSMKCGASMKMEKMSHGKDMKMGEPKDKKGDQQ